MSIPAGILAIQILLPLASVICLQQFFSYPIRTIYYHGLFLVFANLALASLAVGSAALLRPRSWGWYLIFGIWGIFFVALYFIHLLSWIGSLYGGHPFSFDVALPYISDPCSLKGFTNPALVWTGLLVLPGMIFALYLLAAPLLGRFACQALERARRVPTLLRRHKWWALSAALLIATAFATTNHFWPIEEWKASYVEPVVASLGINPTLIPIRGAGLESAKEAADYQVPQSFQQMNIILIVVDAMRSDQFGFTRYPRKLTPFLDALVESGKLQAAGSAYAASSSTFGGLMSILRSRHVFNMHTRAFALHDVLKKAGYRVHFLLSGDHVHYSSLKYYFGNGMDTFADGSSWQGYAPDPAIPHAGSQSPQRNAGFGLNDDSGLLATLRAMPGFDGTPSFFYFHLMSVHEAGIRHPENEVYQPAAGALGDVEKFTNHNDNGLIQADKMIRDLLGELDRKGFLKNSLVVITSDHGQSLGEKGFFGHAKNLNREELAIPVMVLDSEGKNIPNFRMVRQVDIAPTILDRIGLPIPESWDGVSLYRQPSARFSYHQLLDKYGIIDSTEERTLKYTFDADHEVEELYDITADPAEIDNLVGGRSNSSLSSIRVELKKFKDK